MLPFQKYSGAGNDFVVVEAARADDPAGLARRICPRRTGVGVDGLILARPAGDAAVRVRFFNPDGSEFGTCGNGSRCVARWAAARGLDRDGEVLLVTSDGDVPATVSGEDVTLEYTLEAWVEGRRRVPFPGGPRDGWLVMIGTPHFVLPVDRLPDDAIDEVCRPIRHHEAMGPQGANVDLVEVAGEDRARIRTFERGVEGETLACGSGAMAAALALAAAERCGHRLTLRTRSGHDLRVRLVDPEGGPPPGQRARRRIRLSGPARLVFEGRFPVGAGEAGPASAPADTGRHPDADPGATEPGDRRS